MSSNKVSWSYKILGISKAEKLSPEVLKTAYKKVARTWHPDLNSHRLDEATEKFKEIQQAYNSLLYMIEKEGGQLPAGVLNAHEFFKHFGFDRLAEITEETLEDISMDRAVMGLGANVSGAVGALDGKLMGKLKLWARGPDYRSDVKTLDSLGHFTDAAIKNILEYALVYEKADTVEKRKKAFSVHEYTTHDTDPYDQKLAEIIRGWVSENYVRTRSLGWVHRSKKENLMVRLRKDLSAAAASIPDSKEVRDLISRVDDCIGEKNLKDAGVALGKVVGILKKSLEDSFEGKMDSVGAKGDSPEKNLTNARKKLKSSEDELAAIAKRCGVAADVIEALAKNDSAKEDNPVLELVSDRVIAVASEIRALTELLSKVGDQVKSANGGKKATATRRIDNIISFLASAASDIEVFAS